MIHVLIPTYNNKFGLFNNLTRLLPYLREDLITVDVFDNCSDYNVLSVFSDFIKEGIEFTINSQNCGGDENIFNCYSKYNNGWIWVLSDNDILKVEALDYIFELVNDNFDSAFISLNNPNVYSGRGFKDFCIKTFYPNMFTISNLILRIENYNLEVYRSKIHSNQGHLLGLIHKMYHHNIAFIGTDYNPFSVKKLATWNRSSFLQNELSNFDCFPESLYIMRQKKSRFQMQVNLIRESMILRQLRRRQVMYFLVLIIQETKYLDVKSVLRLFLK